MARKKSAKQFSQDALIDQIVERFLHGKLVRDPGSLISVISVTDDFRAIVLGMAWVDNLITMLLEETLANPKALNLENMGFAQKLNIADSIGALIPGTKGVLSAIGTIRNRFAHRVSYRLNSKVAKPDLQRLKDELNNDSLKATTDWLAAAPLIQNEMIQSAAAGSESRKPEVLNEDQALVRAVIYLCHYSYDRAFDAATKPRPEIQNLQSALAPLFPKEPVSAASLPEETTDALV